jgi:uncharacterized protein (TIRG00374 family)
MNKARLKFVLKLMVSLALLAYLVMQAELDGIMQATKNTRWPLVILVFFLFFVHFFIGTFRWRALARLHGAEPRLSYLFRSYMVANFFNNFLPSTIGGDIVRIYDTWRAGTSKAGAAATILVERVLGILALAMLAAVGIALLGVGDILSSELVWLVGILIVGLLSVVILLFYPPFWWTRLIQSLVRSNVAVVSRMADIVQRVSGEFQGARSTLALALLLSFLVQGNVILEYYLIGIAIGIDLHPAVFVAIVPLALVMIMLPVSVNGIGLREGVFTLLFGLFGVGVASALLFSWIFYALFVAHGILGGVVYILREDRLPSSKVANL